MSVERGAAAGVATHHGITVGVVIPCRRQESRLPRTVAALERALAGRDWRGVLVLAAPGPDPLPALSSHWSVLGAEAGAAGGPGSQSLPLTPGAARMLGFDACGGEWVLFVDADVEVDDDWMASALDRAAREPGLGGLWGRLEEWFDGRRGDRLGMSDMYHVGETERRTSYLATLAFYRRAALAEAGGYDPRLSSEEDFELGLRLGRRGLELRSLGLRAGRHWSAPRPSFAELARRWRTGLCFGQGQVLRLYAGRPGFGRLLARQGLYLATLALWLSGAAVLVLALVRLDPSLLLAWAMFPLGLIAAMIVRKGSPRLGFFSWCTWSVNAFGLAAGLGGAGLRPAPAGAPARGAGSPAASAPGESAGSRGRGGSPA